MSQIYSGLRNRDFLPSDRVYKSGAKFWSQISELSLFSPLDDVIALKRSEKLEKLPSPRSFLNRNKEVLLPKIPPPPEPPQKYPAAPAPIKNSEEKAEERRMESSSQEKRLERNASESQISQAQEITPSDSD